MPENPRPKREPPPPPPGPPWDLPLDEAPLAFLDLEMTGLDVARDRVVEVCVERVVGNRVEASVATLVRPDDDRIGGCAHVHGLDEGALAHAPPFAAVLPDVKAALDGAVIVAHAAIWDVDFLRAEAARAGADLSIAHWLDTLVLARRAFAFHRNSLGALCEQLAIPRGRAHRAEDDVRALRALFDRCASVLRPQSVRDLWEVRVGERRARAAIVDACEAAAEHAAPVLLTYRPSRRPPQELRMVILEVRADFDPPRVLGYELPGRGRRELRADRILRVEPGGAA